MYLSVTAYVCAECLKVHMKLCYISCSGAGELGSRGKFHSMSFSTFELCSVGIMYSKEYIKLNL